MEVVIAQRKEQNHFIVNLKMLKTEKGYQKAILLVYFVMHYFLFENENKQGFFETLSRQSIVLISSFPRMKSSNYYLW